MTFRRRLTGIALAAVAAGTVAIGAPPPEPAQTPSRVTRPRLIVIIVADQFRSDYITWYRQQWTAGLKRLLDEGAVFSSSAYTYATTKTCPGHATIATGRLPSAHGLIDNQWYDRAAGRIVVCTEDPAVEPISFGDIAGREHHGISRLMVTTFADELRAQSKPQPRVVALSLKPRSAIPLAGRGSPGTIAVWAEPNGAWTTSTLYTTKPWVEVDEFIKGRPIAGANGHVWTRLLNPAAYLNDDAAPGEPAANVFPHSIAGRSGKPDATFATVWQRSPLSDAYLGAMAGSLAERLKLGQVASTDLLAMSFSALDFVGHLYGPRSHEVQDVLANLDRTIGQLMDTLDRLVGKNQYVVGFTSDHGVPEMPEQLAARGMPAGRVSMTAVRRALEDALVPTLGGGSHVASVTSPYIYFTPDALARIQKEPKTRQAATAAMSTIAGVRRVVWADELSNGARGDTVLTAVRRSFVAGRTGDLILVYEPNWVPQSTGTTHGAPWDHDQRVPLVLHGAGVAAGRYQAASGPLDLAPTLARLAGITFARTDGRVLTEALAR